ncbi:MULTISPECIES: phage regulatory CII family protein [unclassified Pseudomonas]|uniref:phage regulatory CII family protein n=1 Tax=unclassified Pseudomonas TaxID=196821 RepID=UPI00244ABE3D|nr:MULTISPECIES: phage regulatory CII family protein [unclassified Pseudomonas]MDG9928282.1 Rha family transcriptional regulator [Pseudomonas sp. GD04042]MDH0481154.1 Rha family transcriptional regulator [Pseudomonas sp. GD04015]MDH0604490.1 Rha family transcriptional regulator [Pseudomonas sp. GD03869]
MDQFLRACHAAVHDAEPKRLAAQMGLPHMSLLQRANPDNDAHKLTINQLFQILMHTRDMRPLQALAEEFGFDLVAREGAAPKNLAAALLHMHGEVADVTKAVTEALADNVLTREERQGICTEIGEARKSLDVLEASVKEAS